MTYLKRRRLAVRSSAAIVTALAVIGPTAPFASGAADVARPAGLSVSPAGSSTPVLAWTRVPAATTYQVQVDNDASFGSLEVNVSTANLRATPLTALGAGTNHWRVRAVKGTETSTWATSSFAVSAINVPVPTSPVNGAPLAQPASPPLLQWQGSTSAQSYTVEVDADADFVGAKSYSTKTTSLVVPDPLGEGDWFWRVTAIKGAGLVSLPSGAMSFVILPLEKPRLISPADSVESKVQDVVLDWEPVSGARSYDVQVSDGPSFDPASTTTATGVQGTRYSPKVTLNNDQFWWRVRAVDLNGQATTWAQTNFGFNRVYENQPVPVYPLGTTGSPTPISSPRPFYQWTSVPHATEYELLTSGDATFTNLDVCRTTGTTYAPRNLSDCGFHPSGNTYWMVRPIDKPYDNTGLPGQLFSQPQAFTWTPPATVPGSFDPTAEVQGMKVSVDGTGAGCSSTLCDGVPTTPVFSWDPMPGATSYQVYIGQDNKFTTSVLATRSLPMTTTNTMLNLESRTQQGSPGDQVATLPDSSAGQAYHWYVRACTTNPAVACGPLPISAPLTLGTKAFRKVSPPITGLSASSGAGTEITFTWQDYYNTGQATTWNSDAERGNQSARGYHIQVDNEPSFQAPLLDEQTVDQATYTAIDRLYPEGTLYWRVQATDAETNGLTWSEVQSVTKASPAVPLLAPANGAIVPGTVPFRWEPQPFAASYTLEVYKNNDTSFSSVNRLFTSTVKTPAFAWNQPIPADANAYVWRVRRTDAEGNPGPWSAVFSFTSLGAAPILTSPAAGSWQPIHGALLTWSDVPGAASYSVQVSAGGSRVAGATTPGNAFATTALLRTGTHSWQVTALDAAGKPLGTSVSRDFRVDATPPKVVKVKPGKPKAKSDLKVIFSEAVKGISKKTVKLKRANAKGKYKVVKAKVKVKKAGKLAIINPKGRLKKGTYVIVFKNTVIKDLAGNPLVDKKINAPSP